jgi:glutamine amidotransferase
MRVTIFDYGAGNLHSLGKALALGGTAVRLEPDAARCVDTDLLVLPGVGAYGQAAARLAPSRTVLRDGIRAGLPTIGICLGMQLLFDASAEGEGSGLGLFAGLVTRVRARRVPHIGWNELVDVGDGTARRTRLETPYFANGYACRPADESIVTAWCVHEDDRFPAVVRAGSTVGVQFHPEKSGATGVAFLRALVEEALCS